VNSLICLGRVSTILDRDTLSQIVVPILEYCIQMDQSATTLMSIIGVFHKISKQFDPNYIAVKILPVLLPLAMQKSLNYEQFQKYMKSIKTMIDVVEDSRLKEFNQQKQLDEVKTNDSDIKQILNEEYKEKPQQQQPVPKTQVLPPIPYIMEEKKLEPQQPSLDDLLDRKTSFNQSTPYVERKEIIEKKSIPSFDDLIDRNMMLPTPVVVEKKKVEEKKIQIVEKTTTTPSFDDLLDRNMHSTPTPNDKKFDFPPMEPKKNTHLSFDDLLNNSQSFEPLKPTTVEKKIFETPKNSYSFENNSFGETPKQNMNSFETPKQNMNSFETPKQKNSFSEKKENLISFDDFSHQNQSFKGFEDDEDFDSWGEKGKNTKQSLDFDSMMKNFQ